MAKGYTFLDFAKDVLKNSQKPLTFMEIWKVGIEKGLDKNIVNNTSKTPWQTLGVRLYTDIKREDSIFYVYSKKPTLFWLKDKKFIESKLLDSINLDTKDTQKDKFNERDLHPLLVKFANTEFNAYCKTIYHEKSKRSIGGKDKWIHPDIVGVHFAFMDDYRPETLEIMKGVENEFELFSFELKIRLDWSNYKESYFQAVSNSSWANQGYLVIFEKIDDELLKELGRLNNSFGIGVIDLSNEIDKVVLESEEREIDFETLDMLVEKNENFKEFIQAVNKDKNSDKHRIGLRFYDKVLDDEAMEKHIKEKL